MDLLKSLAGAAGIVVAIGCASGGGGGGGSSSTSYDFGGSSGSTSSGRASSGRTSSGAGSDTPDAGGTVSCETGLGQNNTICETFYDLTAKQVANPGQGICSGTVVAACPASGGALGVLLGTCTTVTPKTVTYFYSPGDNAANAQSYCMTGSGMWTPAK